MKAHPVFQFLSFAMLIFCMIFFRFWTEAERELVEIKAELERVKNELKENLTRANDVFHRWEMTAYDNADLKKENKRLQEIIDSKYCM